MPNSWSRSSLSDWSTTSTESIDRPPKTRFRSIEPWQPDEDSEVLEVLASILCNVLLAKKTCLRSDQDLHSHPLFVFTNYRTVQVYCIHDPIENIFLSALALTDSEFCKLRRTGKAELTYEDFTKKIFRDNKRSLVWEAFFPEGLDMEALSPRDANVQVRVKPTTQKEKPLAAQTLRREKDHPPPPPATVVEPPSGDSKDGVVYRTGRLLGKGGFAICYEGQSQSTKQKYALKIVKSHMPQKKMEQKFQTELQIHSKMNHPNIVQFHRAFTYQQSTYIVLELCPNGSLMDMVKKRRFFTEPEVRYYTIQISGAIKYMHAKGIIHRDLKMGNIFLDKDMNVKIGDFGLAALLMSGKDMSACRRTTLCGTPNYIAPEILEKGKRGHDHAVDIWSLGIIIFAMLTGRPPFQSTTQEEIYRKAREREYDWPKMDTSENSICQEAKDLVSVLLQSPEDRPDPDTIVQHPFFSCGWVPEPQEMTSKLIESAPGPSQFIPLGLRSGRAKVYTKNLRKLCERSDVGPSCQTQKIRSSTYREVAAEEKAGLTPAVPLPDDVVYRPFAQWLKEQVQRQNAERQNAEVESSSRTNNPPESEETALPVSCSSKSAINRTGQQSFAAQQRAQNQPMSNPSAQQSVSLVPKLHASIENARAGRKPSSTMNSATVEPNSSITGPRKANPKQEAPGEQKLKVEISAEARLGADLAQQLKHVDLKKKASDVTEPYVRKRALSLFSTKECPELVPKSRPDQILIRLKKFQTQLERALNSRSMVANPLSPECSPNIVVKWVDYTNKFGLGYILNSGSVGCIFRSSLANSGFGPGRIPPTCVIVRDAERHLQSRGDEKYHDRHQIVPTSGSDIEFYENRKEEGIVRVDVDPHKFTVNMVKEGEPGRLSRGKDAFDDRKSEKIVLWNKFAKYMTAFGRDQDYPYDDALKRTKDDDGQLETVVTFYQRFGDVGCWGFSDDSFQFNFPDHTKIVLSGDGYWCDFYHLPLEAARDLAETGSLPPSALDDRQHLSHPLQTLLNFMAKPNRSKSHIRTVSPIDPLVQGIPQINDFRKKVEFIKTVVAEWVRNGGLGNSDMRPEARLRWLGHRETVNVKIPYKHVWVTIGARGGDDRRVAWFNPKNPEEIVPDIEA